jgi:hypothetical protein
MARTRVTTVNSQSWPCECKFELVGVIKFRVKAGKINSSIDWVDSNDYAMLGNVFAEINFVRAVTLFSDKVSIKLLENLETDYSEDLTKSPFESKVTFNRYTRDASKLVDQ